MAAALVSLRADTDRPFAERAELETSLKRIEALTAASCGPIAQGCVDGDAVAVNNIDDTLAEQTIRMLVQSRTEVKVLRTELDLIKREFEQLKREETVRCTRREQDAKDLMKLKQEVVSLRTDLMQTQRNLVAVKTTAEAVRGEVIRLRHDAAVQGKVIDIPCTIQEEIQKAREAAESRHRHFAEVETSKRQAFESELRALFESRMAPLTMEINKSREEAIEKPKTECEVSESRYRERRILCFEMVEAEALKREAQTASIEQLRTTCERNLRELAAKVETQRKTDQEDQHVREESLLWLQEEIQRELHEFQHEVSQKLSVYSDQLKEIQDEHRSRSQVLDEPPLVADKQPDDTRRLLRDQYLQLTVQIRELRDFVNSGLEKERRDRSQELTALLQTIQQLVAIG